MRERPVDRVPVVVQGRQRRVLRRQWAGQRRRTAELGEGTQDAVLMFTKARVEATAEAERLEMVLRFLTALQRAGRMNVLVLNVGSSTLKFELIGTDFPDVAGLPLSNILVPEAKRDGPPKLVLDLGHRRQVPGSRTDRDPGLPRHPARPTLGTEPGQLGMRAVHDDVKQLVAVDVRDELLQVAGIQIDVVLDALLLLGGLERLLDDRGQHRTRHQLAHLRPAGPLPGRPLRALAESQGLKPASLIHATRVAVTGRSVSPGLFEVPGEAVTEVRDRGELFRFGRGDAGSDGARRPTVQA